jgi:hypothetical protein
MTKGSGTKTGVFSNKLLDPSAVNLGTNTGAGLTKFVELIPNKKDSISGALLDILFHGIWAGFMPLPGSFVSYAAPY